MLSISIPPIKSDNAISSSVARHLTKGVLYPGYALAAQFRPSEKNYGALLVEDSLIIAMDCADTLKSLGAAHVTTAASLAKGRAAIEARDFQFALLDFNLGAETSITIANVLVARGVRFAFATGNDGNLQGLAHESAPVIGKPYGKEQLIPLLIRLGFEAKLPT